MEVCSRRGTLESFRPYHDSISSISNSVRASKLRGFAAVLAEVETFTNFQDEVLCKSPTMSLVMRSPHRRLLEPRTSEEVDPTVAELAPGASLAQAVTVSP